MLRPINGRVFLTDIPDDDMTRSGIILLKGRDPTRDVRKAKIKAICDDYTDSKGKKRHIEPELKVGVEVLYVNRTILKNGKSYNPNIEKEDGEEYIIANVEDILSIIE